jgi:hypothetical protein
MIIAECSCKLCCTGELPGKESHLFSEMLIKETVNMPGKANYNRKNHELLFTISPLEGVDLFFGRNATQGFLDYTKIDELTDEEVEEFKAKENPLTDKYLVCSKCEDSFNPVENNFKKIYDNIIANTNNEPQKDFFEVSESEKNWIDLFILMNIWRTSASDKYKWNLDDNNHTCLTELMYHTFVGSTTDTIIQRFQEGKEKYNCLQTLCFFIKEERIDPENPNQNFIFCNKSIDPYLLVVNRLIIFISSNNFDSVSPPKMCEGVIDKGRMLHSIQYYSKQLPYIEYDLAQGIHKNCFNHNNQIFIEHVLDTYKIAYQKILQQDVPKEKMQKVYEIAVKNIKDFYEYGKSESNLIRELSIDMHEEYMKLKTA